MDWNSKPTTQKGNLGEQIIREYLVKLGFVPYSPEGAGAHPFDKLCAAPNKKEIFIAECKTKARRDYYPDTGIDKRHYDDYKFIADKHNLRIFIFFIDEKLGKIYGNFMDELEKERDIVYHAFPLRYPKIESYKSGVTIIYFPMAAMISIGDLRPDQVQKLKELSTRNPVYKAEL
jgi:hypothetical protein